MPLCLLYYLTANHNLIEDHNFYGVSRLGSTEQIDLAGVNPTSGQWLQGDTGKSCLSFPDRDFAAFDLRGMASSPGINSGISIAGLSEDLDGYPIVGNPDIGSYEFGRLNRLNYYYRGKR